MNSATLKIMLMIIFLCCCLQWLSVSSFEFQVGDANIGWSVPPSNDTNMYNAWASDNRFRVGDSIRFKYRKDSVMDVREQDYKICNSTQPMFFSNNGDTVFKFDYSGSFYFISGASGHCEMGQKMILKVMAPGDQDYNTRGLGKSSANSMNAVLPYEYFSKLFVLVCCCSCLLF